MKSATRRRLAWLGQVALTLAATYLLFRSLKISWTELQAVDPADWTPHAGLFLASLVVLLALTLSGCASIVMRPAVDDVRTVALVSVYMNREFYNTRSPLAGEGQAAVASLVQAASRTAFEKLLDREADGTRFRLIGIGVSNYAPALECDPPDLADPGSFRRKELERTMDQVRERFGRDAIVKGRDLTK